MHTITIYGGVIVAQKVYENAEIAKLVHVDVGHFTTRSTAKTGWTYSGDAGSEGDILVIVNGDSHSFYGRFGLKEALAFLKALLTYCIYKVQET